MTGIRQFMSAQGVSNKQMAEMLGVTSRTVINWTQGHKKTPLSVTLLMEGVQTGEVSLDWWRDQAKSLKGEQ